MTGAFAPASGLRRRIHVYSQGAHKAAANCGNLVGLMTGAGDSGGSAISRLLSQRPGGHAAGGERTLPSRQPVDGITPLPVSTTRMAPLLSTAILTRSASWPLAAPSPQDTALLPVPARTAKHLQQSERSGWCPGCGHGPRARRRGTGHPTARRGQDSVDAPASMRCRPEP